MPKRKMIRMEMIRRKLNAFRKDRKGSESVEMVVGAAMLCAMILSCTMILSYAIQASQVSYAAKRIARAVEVSGTANQTDVDALLAEFLPNHDDLSASVNITAPEWFNVGNRQIQLRKKFTVTVDASYPVTLMNPGFGADAAIQYRLPIHCIVNGQAEIYWKDGTVW